MGFHVVGLVFCTCEIGCPAIQLGRGLGLEVRVVGWHAGDPGSSPRHGRPLYNFRCIPPVLLAFLGWISALCKSYHLISF
jgi:hypothetical protein